MHINGFRRDRACGFTLAEILITLLILGFIGALGIPMLGQQKVKKPIQSQTKHGTMECFWVGDQLYQYTDTNDRKSGEAVPTPQNVTAQGYCQFSVPKANLYQLQTVGAGGIGAPDYTYAAPINSTIPVKGQIPTDTTFYTALHDTDNVPDWVRTYWDTQWEKGAAMPQYVLISPLGSSGKGICDIAAKGKDRRDAECDTTCGSIYIAGCKEKCYDVIEQNGGDSGNGGQVTVASKLFADDVVSFTTTTTETKLTVGSKYARLAVSGDGGNAYQSGETYSDGAKGRNLSQSNSSDWQIVGGNNGNDMKALLTNIPSAALVQAGAKACEGAGLERKSGELYVTGTGYIPYETQALAVTLNFGTAGSKGALARKFFEKLPSSVELRFYPVKDANSYGQTCSDGSGRCSTVEMRRGSADSWTRLMEANNGSNGTTYVQQQVAISSSSDFPFPKVPITGSSIRYPDSFATAKPDLSIASGNGYVSYLASNLGYNPGESGGGAYPHIGAVSGSTYYKINGVDVATNVALDSISAGATYACPDGVEHDGDPAHGGNSCGFGNTLGKSGVVLISW